jgi:hypothetical protein
VQSLLLGIAALLLAAAPAFAAGAIYQCRDRDGRLSFQDRPCAPHQKSSALSERTEPEPPPEAEPGAPLLEIERVPAPVKVPPGKAYVVDRASLDTSVWREALERARELPPIRAGTGRLTLLRIFLEDAAPAELLQAESVRLRALHQEFGGGRYQQLGSGDFVVMEHVDSAQRRGGRDPLRIGALGHGRSELWVPVPRKGQVGVLGDVVLARAPETTLGEIRARVEVGPQGRRPTRFVVGPVTVGGPYGESFRCNAEGLCSTSPLAPGTYRVLFPEFDPVRSRWTVEVAAGQTTDLHFRSLSDRRIQWLAESQPDASGR